MPKFIREIVNHSDETSIIVWKVNVDVQVNDSEIQSWLKRDDKEKSTIISQTHEALKASDENDKKIEDLREKYNRAMSQAERDSIIKQMNDADRDFLANQKLEEANKLYYVEDYQGAIKIYNEAIKLKPNWDLAYNNRGLAYGVSFPFQFERAIQDFNKAIELNTNFATAYHNRGFTYSDLGQYERAIKDFNKAIELNPNNSYSYYNRGKCYQALGDEEKAQADFAKAKELGYNG
ncbi:MAG: tetratricopeptide repeat protein [Selenomonadaceae bacterium]|nr:tetratricopeptide repeat protein [Selenomonadaceae bacterium]